MFVSNPKLYQNQIYEKYQFSHILNESNFYLNLEKQTAEFLMQYFENCNKLKKLSKFQSAIECVGFSGLKIQIFSAHLSGFSFFSKMLKNT